MSLQLPTIHLNGTSKESLLEDLEKAYVALTAAIKAMCNACPNGRDYYPQGPEALERAQKEHYSRLDRVNEVQKELADLAEGIYKGGHGR